MTDIVPGDIVTWRAWPGMETYLVIGLRRVEKGTYEGSYIVVLLDKEHLKKSRIGLYGVEKANK